MGRGALLALAGVSISFADCLAQPGDSAGVPAVIAADSSVAAGAVVPADASLRPIARDPGCHLSGREVRLARAGIAGAFVGGNVTLWHYFKQAWWSGERSDGFFFNADWDQEFRDQDKFGHFLGGYHLARFGYDGLRAACVSKNKALFASAAYAAFFQLQIEIFDARYKKYGFSYPDLIANTAGMGLQVAQEVYPKLKAVKPTISYLRSPAMRNRDNFPTELRPSLDYSGQTYWFAVDVNSLLPAEAKRYWPSLLRVSAGHTITDWINPQTGATQRAQRRILLSLDLDPEHLPGDHPLWRTIKHTLSYYHFPSPAIQLAPGFRAIPWFR